MRWLRSLLGRVWRGLLCGVGLHDERTTNWLWANWHVECRHCGRGWVLRVWGKVRFDRPHARAAAKQRGVTGAENRPATQERAK